MAHSARARAGRGAALAALLLTLLCLPGVTGAGPSSPHPGAPMAGVPIPLAEVRSSAAAHGLLHTEAGGASSLVWSLATIYYGNGTGDGYYFGEGASMAINDPTSNVTIFGGLGSAGLTNITINYNASDGVFETPVLLGSPSPRANASFADDSSAGVAVLFGGITDLATQAVSNETWVYYFANQTWRNVTGPIAPPAREGSAMAINLDRGSALLEGGVTPSASVGGGTGAVLWNDTWQLNLSSFRWTEVPEPVAPPPAFGGAMIWDPVSDSYTLFGGCGLVCGADTWRFVYGLWFRDTPAGWNPAARGGATFTWDDVDRVGLLYGGFIPRANHLEGLGDGAIFDPTLGNWSALDPSPNLAGARYGAPSGWADFPGCTGMLLVGGNVSLLGPPQNLTILQPPTLGADNCVHNGGTGVNNAPPPNCSIANTSFLIRVVDNTTGLGLPGASVSVDGGCVQRLVTTGPGGYIALSLPSPDKFNLTATLPGYRPARLVATIFPNGTNSVTIPLAPYPALDVRTLGFTASGLYLPLTGAEVDQGASLVLGTSDASAWVNVSHLNAPGGLVDLVGVDPGWSEPHRNLTLPYTGRLVTNLTFLAAANLSLEVVNYSSGAPLAGAQGLLTDRGPGAPLPLHFVTDRFGWANLTAIVSSNYTFTGSAVGYLNNSTTFFHPWRLPHRVVLPLHRAQGATLDVVLRNEVDGFPIVGGNVTVVGHGTLRTGGGGWANFTDVLPVGPLQVQGNATGYLSNATWVTTAYYEVLAPFFLNLTPLPNCPSSASCLPVPGPSAATPFQYVFGTGTEGALLVVAPAIFAVVALAYLVALRRAPEPRDRDPYGTFGGGRT